MPFDRRLTPGPDLDVELTSLQLVQVMQKVTGAIAGTRPDYKNLRYAEEFFAKYYSHLLSALYLYRGTSIPELKIAFHDDASIPVVCRAAIETFLTFFYLYSDPEDPDHARFRFDAWWRAGLVRRQAYQVVTSEDQLKQHEEKEAIDRLTESLSGSPFFAQLSGGQQKQLLKGEWRFHGWADIARRVGFSELYSKHLYSFLSAYAHTDSQSLMQLSQIAHESNRALLAKMRLSMYSMILVIGAHFTVSYGGLFPDAGAAVSNEDKVFLRPWLTLPTIEAKP